MANPTSAFGWQMPTSTDLVTDLPADFEVFGQAVDTSLADLKGGTTGQVLSKATNADMDFTWVTTDDANAIQNSIVDAKGDLIAASANDTPARLAVGNNGETLVADSSTSTGLRYQAPVQQNPVLNSAMQIWQRGTSSAIAVSSFTFFGPDRWQVYRGDTGSTVSRQVTGDTTNLPNIQYCARFQRDSGNSTTAQFYIANNFETINSIPFAGKTVTFSFYARAGANYSATSSNLVANLRSGTGTDQNFNNTYTGNTLVAGGSTTLTSTWQRFTYTGTVPTTSTELCVFFNSTPTGTAGAADYFDITGVQVEVGSVATPFKTYAGTIQGELAACQRYYFRATAGATFSEFGYSVSRGSATSDAAIQVPVILRRVPTSVDWSTLQVSTYAGGASQNVTNIVLSTSFNASDYRPQVTVTAAASIGSAGNLLTLQAGSSTAAFIGFNAEL
jgi:uncharacterized protein YgiM (DUF1202 family)